MHWRDYVHQHVAGVIIGCFCAWVTLSLLVRLWLVHKQDSSWKRLRWSFVVCIPFFGWLAYGAFYAPLNDNDVPAPIGMPGTGSGG